MSSKTYKNIPNEFVTADIYIPDNLKNIFLKKDTIVISGGGLYFIDMIGLIDNLKYNKIFPEINWAFGTSAGSIASLYIILDVDGKELTYNIGKILHKKQSLLRITPISIVNFITKGYFVRVLKNKSKIIEVVLKMGGLDNNSTFEDLYKKTKKHLVVICSEFFTGDLLYFSYLTTPYIKVYDAVNASSNIPNLYRPEYVPVKGRKSNWYVDGTVSSEFAYNAVINNTSKLYYGNYISEEDKIKYGVPDYTTGKVFGITTYTSWLYSNEYYNQNLIVRDPPKQKMNIINMYFNTTVTLYNSQYASIPEDTVNQIIIIYDNVASKVLSKIGTLQVYQLYNTGVGLSVVAFNNYVSSNGTSFN